MLLLINTGKRKNGTEKNIGNILTSNDISLLVKNENKLNTTKQITNKFDTIKEQSVLETCKSSIHKVHSQVSILRLNL